MYAFCDSGFAEATAASAALRASSGPGFAPFKTASASGERYGVGATEPNTTRALRIVPPDIVSATQTSTSGQSNDSFSLSFR